MAAAVSAPALALPVHPQPTPAMHKAAKEFEAMLISQLMAPMFEALQTDGMFGGGSGEAMFRPMLIEQYAQGIAKAGGIGIADSVAREMLRLQGMDNSQEQTHAAAG